MSKLNVESVIVEEEAMNMDPSTSSSQSSPAMDLQPNISMSSSELKEFCELTIGKEVKVVSVLGDNLPSEIPKGNVELHPGTPSVLVKTKREAFSPQLQKYLLQLPIAVVRGLPSALNMNLSLFSTVTLVETHPNHPVDELIQKYQSPDDNRDENGKQVWNCDYRSQRESTTIFKYASYQAANFRSSSKSPMLKFATNIDLADEKQWKKELQELQKLPSLVRVSSAGNMLSHVGHPILGMNTVQLYMKVPGSRTPGHQENNNFASVNINIGPGDTEWFAVPNEYWTEIRKMCEVKQISYLNGYWWPDVTSLEKARIPVYRFTQKPGDLVWVNPGCVHWVQALGYCNNIAWNVGPFTSTQYQLAMERYEWNKSQNFRSLVPMTNLSWNLARNFRVSDAKLFDLIKNTLMKSLLQCFHTLEYAQTHKVEVEFHGHEKNEPSPYCGQCKVEVFNIHFVKERQRRPEVHCIDCVKKQTDLQGLICLEQYRIKDLMEIYDNFVLYEVSPLLPSKIKTSSH